MDTFHKMSDSSSKCYSKISISQFFFLPHLPSLIPSNLKMYYWNHINWYKMNLLASNWNMLYWKWHEYSMSLSPFYFYEYSWVCVSIGNTGLPRETTHRACPRPLIPLLSFISPVLCHHHSSLFDTAQCCRLLFSSPLLPTYPHCQFLYLYLFHSTRFKNIFSA